MTLNQKSGNSNYYSVANINKITFQNGNVIIETKSATNNFSIAGLKNLVFDQIITEVEELSSVSKELSVYPNPCGDVLNISKKTNDTRYFIYDLNGSLIQSDKAFSRINVSNLTTGVYFLKLVGQTNTQTLKIIKK